MLQTLKQNAKHKSSEIAFQEWPSGKTITWHQLYVHALNCAASVPIPKNCQSVGLVRSNQIEDFVLLVSFWLRGLPVAFLSPTATPLELSFFKTNLPNFWIVSASANDSSPPTWVDLHYRLELSTLSTNNDFTLTGTDWTRRSDQLALILTTSGTTGAPKFIAFTHLELMAGALLSERNASLANFTSPIVNLRPGFTSGGCNTLWPSWLTGATNLIVPFHHPMAHFESLNQLLTAINPDLIVASPALLKSWVLSNRTCSKLPESQKRTIYFGGERISLSLFLKLKNLIPGKYIMRYGFTESSHIICQRELSNELLSYESVGTLFAEVQAKAIGHGRLAFKSKGIAAQRFLKGERLSNLQDGWFLTEDEGSICEQQVVLRGRDRFHFNVNGFRFHKSEIEAAMTQISEVSDFHLMQVSHPIYGDHYRIFIETAKADTEETIEKICTLLGPHKKPLQIVALSKFPVSANGKKDLRALLRSIPHSTQSEFEYLGILRRRAKWNQAPRLKNLITMYNSLFTSTFSLAEVTQIERTVKATHWQSLGKYSKVQFLWLLNGLAFFMFRFHQDTKTSLELLTQALRLYLTLDLSLYPKSMTTRYFWLIILLNESRIAFKENSAVGAKRQETLIQFLTSHALDLSPFSEATQSALSHTWESLPRPKTREEADFFWSRLHPKHN